LTNHRTEAGDRAVRILIANDQEWAARSVETILVAEGYEVHRAYTGRQAIDRALEILPDLAILDTQMPDLSGMEVCRLLRRDSRIGLCTPILLMTAGPAGRAQRVEALQAGAWEFYGQPLDAELLLLKIKLYLEVKKSAEALREANLIDETTGMYNQRGLILKTDELLADARRHPRDLTCVSVTLNDPRFKSVLQEAGSLARRAGEALRGVVRSADIVGRVSALQFAVVAPATSGDGAQRLAARIVEAFRDLGRGEGSLAVQAAVHEVRQADLASADVGTLLEGQAASSASIAPSS
jgi:PleD family two-component response regulator